MGSLHLFVIFTGVNEVITPFSSDVSNISIIATRRSYLVMNYSGDVGPTSEKYGIGGGRGQEQSSLL